MIRTEASVSKLAIAAMAVAMAGGSAVSAATLTWDSGTSAGITTGSSTWDYGNTVNWNPVGGNGSTDRVAWSNNTDIAAFVNPNSAIVTVSSTYGSVGVAGFEFSGTGTSNTFSINGATLQLGSSGINATFTSNVVSIGAPMVLTASQTWSSTSLRSNSNGAGVRAAGALSTLTGATNLTFDGKGVSNAAAMGNTNTRASFALLANNTFVGTTTVTGGAALWLDYTSASGSRLADSSALYLAGGSIVLNNGTNVQEVVASTTVTDGANSIYKGSGNGGTTYNHIQLGGLTHGLAGTLDVSSGVLALASTTTQNTNNILGGWATMGSSWAVGSADGSTANISSSSGSDRSNSGTWVANTDNVNATASESNIVSKTINVLRLKNASVALALAPTATLTLAGGGIMAGNTGQSITGGKITTSAVTAGVGEVFVHTPNDFTIGSEIANNGGTPTALVKAGVNKLTLTGVSTYTGRTYVNSGTLLLDNGGSLQNSNITITGGSLSGGTTGAGGTLNVNVVDDVANMISISGVNGLDLTNLNLNFAFGGSQTQSEYVLVNKAINSGFVVGYSFANTNLDPAAWSIDYDGTAINPGSIVLVSIPEPATAGLLAGAMTLGFLRRRRVAM